MTVERERYWLQGAQEPFMRKIGLADGVAARGSFLFLGGQVGQAADGTVADGLHAQTFQAMQNVKTLVELAGASMADVVQLTILLDESTADGHRGWWEILGAALKEFMPAAPPATTGYWVNQLASRRFLVEIQAIAVLPEAAPA